MPSDQHSEQRQTRKQKTPRSWWTVGIILAVIAVLIFAAYFINLTYTYYRQIEEGTLDLSSFTQGEQTAYEGATTASDPNFNVYVNNYSDDPTFGSPGAPLVIVAFIDFQCPYCRQVFPAVESVRQKYGEEILLVFRDFPLSGAHPDAQKAAEAGQCAHEQGQFWAYHDKLFNNQEQLTVADLKRYAAELSLDTAVFDNCLDTGKYEEEVLADMQDGIQAGVSGTPTFFFNDNRVPGVVTESGFDQIVDYFTNNN